VVQLLHAPSDERATNTDDLVRKRKVPVSIDYFSPLIALCHGRHARD